MSQFVAGLKTGWNDTKAPKGLFALSVRVGAFGAAAILILLQILS